VQEQAQEQYAMEAVGRARHRGTRSALHWVASLTKQHTTNHNGITNKVTSANKNATE
jgi:hypothetical protein